MERPEETEHQMAPWRPLPKTAALHAALLADMVGQRFPLLFRLREEQVDMAETEAAAPELAAYRMCGIITKIVESRQPQILQFTAAL